MREKISMICWEKVQKIGRQKKVFCYRAEDKTGRMVGLDLRSRQKGTGLPSSYLLLGMSIRVLIGDACWA